MQCRICGTKTEERFKAKILGKYVISYYQCSVCRFVQTEEPFWLEEAYGEAINRFDTGLIGRNINNAVGVSKFLFYFCDYTKQCADYAGGYGLFTRMMRDYGFDFYTWDQYAPNLLAKSFEFEPKTDKGFELVTSFEFLEHAVNPLEAIQTMLRLAPTIMFSTNIISDPIPDPSNWWYYGTEHGQHISFYTNKTFLFLAQQLGIEYYSNGIDLHVLSLIKLPREEVELFLQTGKLLKPRLYNIIHRTGGSIFRTIVKQLLGKHIEPMDIIRNTLPSRTQSDYHELRYKIDSKI